MIANTSFYSVRNVWSHPAIIKSSNAWRHSSRVQSAIGLPGQASSSEGPDQGQEKGRSLSSSFRRQEPVRPSDHEGHAILHDFCLSIPFAALGIVASLALLFVGGSIPSLSEALPLFALSSVIIGLASAYSLSLWKKGQTGTELTSMITTISGVTSAFIAYKSWICIKLQTGLAGSMPVLCILWPLLLLSSCLSLFAFYNILAGGNPEKKK